MKKEEQELRLFLYVYCKGNIVDAQLAYNFIMGNDAPKGSDFDIDKFCPIEHMGSDFDIDKIRSCEGHGSL